MYPSFEEQYQKLSPANRRIYERVRFSERIDGWLLLEEAVELYRLVFTTTAIPATFCEIGTWMGKSASIMGKAALDRREAILYAIDPFTGVGDAASMEEYQKKRGLLKHTQLEACRSNLERAGVASAVRIIPHESSVVRETFQERQLNGLFIDGDHAYKSVSEDVRLWSPLLVRGAWLVLHDVGAMHVDGPRRVMDELKHDEAHWRDWRVVGEMAIARRR